MKKYSQNQPGALQHCRKTGCCLGMAKVLFATLAEQGSEERRKDLEGTGRFGKLVGEVSVCQAGCPLLPFSVHSLLQPVLFLRTSSFLSAASHLAAASTSL